MNLRELLLLSPHPLPTVHTLYLGDDEVAAFLHGYSALWHPAALSLASGPPRVGSPYDHDPPRPGAIYAVAEACTGVLSDDWFDRARAAGCIVLRAGTKREDALADLLTQLRTLPAEVAPVANLLDLDADRVGPFLGVGFGLLHVDGLFEAASHSNLVERDVFWGSVQGAIKDLTSDDREAFRRQLTDAANVLLRGREVLQSSSMYFLDLLLLDEEGPTAWPASYDFGIPLNVMATGVGLERLARDEPDRLAGLRQRVANDQAEVCVGGVIEREDAILPLESQLWNLRRAAEIAKETTGAEPTVHARARFGVHAHLPGLLGSVGLTRTTLFALDDSVMPAHRSAVVAWPSLDGRQVETFTRTPQLAGSAQVFFHLTYLIHQTMQIDAKPTVALLHKGTPPAPGYLELLELSKLAPVLGRWMTFSSYFAEIEASGDSYGNYAQPSEADEFADNYLLERTPINETDLPPTTDAITGLAAHHRQRRQFDSATTVLAMAHALGVSVEIDGQPAMARLTAIENDLETGRLDPAALERASRLVCEKLAERLVGGGGPQPGYLLLNPCSFTRRVVVELPGCVDLLPIEGAVKACQVDGGSARAVVEVPALGFAWLPAQGQRGLAANIKRMKLADERHVRNEFFEAEIDVTTGGLRAVRDHKTRVNRLGQQLVYQPGSTMKATKIEVRSTGPGLGELVTEGVLIDAQNQVLAHFRQRLQAWIGRPLLEMVIEIEPVAPPRGYAWHAYYASRFATPGERTPLIRGVCEVPSLGLHHRPETPDYLEFRTGQQNVVIFPRGMPFHQRQGNRMLDVLLICAGETATRFELGIGLDRQAPMQTAQGLLTPVMMVPTPTGPPRIGTSGWLFHLDAPNLLMTSMRPLATTEAGRVIQARFHEIGGHPGQAELHCVRDPSAARIVDGRGRLVSPLQPNGDSIGFEFVRHDLVQVELVL